MIAFLQDNLWIIPLVIWFLWFWNFYDDGGDGWA